MSKVANFNLPHLHLAPPLRVTPFEFCRDLWHQKTRVPGPVPGSYGVFFVILCLAILVEHRLVTDRQTHNYSICHASMASRGKNLNECWQTLTDGSGIHASNGVLEHALKVGGGVVGVDETAGLWSRSGIGWRRHNLSLIHI